MIGERLAEVRKDNGWTQAELAERLAVSKYTISSYETEKTEPDDETKIKIARLFNISIDYFVGLINEPFSYDRGVSVMLLPENLPPMMREQVADYAAYLSDREEKRKQTV